MRAPFLIAIALFACRPRQPAPPPPPPPAPQVVLHGARMQMFRGSELVMVGRAAKVTYQRVSADASATEAVLRWPSRSAPRRRGMALSGVEVRAPELDGNLYARQADGRGGILLRTSSGIVARTEDAHFDGSAMKMRGTSPVGVTGPGYSLDASGFELDFDDQRFEFTQTASSITPGGGK